MDIKMYMIILDTDNSMYWTEFGGFTSKHSGSKYNSIHAAQIEIDSAIGHGGVSIVKQ